MAMDRVTCPECPKSIALTPAGRIRSHTVPRAQRRPTRMVCLGTGQRL